jgi:hypothetical protein
VTGNPGSPDELDRLFAWLVRAVRDERPEYLASAFEVGELLAFVPYKLVRADVGVDTNDDYAHALTRLLAGERGLLFVDELMQDDLQNELKAAVPDLQAYRAYLNTRVTLAQERVREVLDALGPAAPREPAPARDEPAWPVPAKSAPAKPLPPRAQPQPVARPVSPRDRPLAASARAVPSATTPVSSGVDPRTSRPGCKYCGQPLPQGRDVRFCPHCGQDLSVNRCGACSAELEPGWKFCVACGRSSSA